MHGVECHAIAQHATDQQPQSEVNLLGNKLHDLEQDADRSFHEMSPETQSRLLTISYTCDAMPAYQSELVPQMQ